jgi:hypothetical protein
MPVVVVLVAPIVVCVCSIYVFFHEKPFADRKAVLEEVVREIRSMNLKPGDLNEFRMVDLSNAKSLHPVELNTYIVGSNGGIDDAGTVYAIVSPSGSLKVEIVTYDRGHLGSSGFLYSDEHLVPETDDDGYLRLDVPNRLDCPNPGTEIEPHWWKVHSTGD